MAPNLRNGDANRSKGRIMGLFKKILTPKTKIKNSIEESTDSHQHYEFDALPTDDNRREEVKSQTRAQPNENCDDDHQTKKENCEPPKKPAHNNHDDDDFHLRNEKHSYSKFRSNAEGCQNVGNQVIYEINNGVGVHIGTSNVLTQNYVINGKSNPYNSRKPKKTEKVKVLLKCKDLIRAGHLEFLSAELGKEWKEVGRILGLSEAELYMIGERWKKQEENNYLKERAFQVLRLWWSQKRGGSAEVGDLCRILWEGESKAVWKALEKLSLNIELFK